MTPYEIVLKHIKEKEGLAATGARKTKLSGPVYNVSGSGKDPKCIEGLRNAAWKTVMIDRGIMPSAKCPGPPASKPDTTHDDEDNFDNGGHVTKNKDNTVGPDKICYLIPLCDWHNHTSRNDTEFNWKGELDAVELSGYFECIPPQLFLAAMNRGGFLLGKRIDEDLVVDMALTEMGDQKLFEKAPITLIDDVDEGFVLRYDSLKDKYVLVGEK